MPPLAVRAAPAEGENAVEIFRDAGLRPVAQGGEIGHEAGVPKQHRHREIRRDREHVPEQRRTEVRPDAVGVRDRREEPRHPHAADVDAGENAGANDGEERHGLGGAVDGRAPLLPGEEKDCRDQRAGVADADPENEVRDVPRPADGFVFSPNADAVRDLVADAEQADQGDQRAGQERHPPPQRGAFFDDARDLVGDPRVLAVVRDERHALEFLRRGQSDGGFSH